MKKQKIYQWGCDYVVKVSCLNLSFKVTSVTHTDH